MICSQLQELLQDLMLTSPGLCHLQDHLHEVLRPGLPERVYSDGETLIRQGEQSTYMLYISEGQVEVTVKLATPRGEAASR